MILCCNDFGTHIDMSVEIIYINSSVYFQLNIDDELVELGRENFMFKHPYSICFLGVTILKLWYLTGVNYVLLGTILWILRLLILLIHNQLFNSLQNFSSFISCIVSSTADILQKVPLSISDPGCLSLHYFPGTIGQRHPAN